MAEIQNFVWAVGEDLKIELIYKEGSSEETAAVIDLSSGYEVRMDVVVPVTNERVYTFNSEGIADVDPNTPGDQTDAEIEGVLSSGSGDTPNISITVPRTLTLPGGNIYAKYTANPKVATFNYDVFLRASSPNTQAKILKGAITIEDSYTLWP